MAHPGDTPERSESPESRPLIHVDIVILPFGLMTISPDSPLLNVEYFADCEGTIECDTDGTTWGF